MLELSSRSGAGEHQSSKLGLYHLTTDTREESKRQGPVYQHLHDGDNEQYYLYRWDFSCTLDIILLSHLLPNIPKTVNIQR